MKSLTSIQWQSVKVLHLAYGRLLSTQSLLRTMQPPPRSEPASYSLRRTKTVRLENLGHAISCDK
jgi:hypothetical protein